MTTGDTIRREYSQFREWFVFILYCFFIICLGAVAREQADAALFIDGAALLTVVYFAVVGGLRGWWREGLRLARFGAALALAWLAKDLVGGLFGLSGMLGGIAGFYATFFLAVMFFGALLGPVAEALPAPGRFGQFFGTLLGTGEGLAIAGLCCIALLLLPPHPRLPLTDLTQRSMILQALAPQVMPTLATVLPAGTTECLELTREASTRGIDPERIDHAALHQQLAPLRDHPKVQTLLNDPEMRTVLAEKNPATVLKHPKVMAILNDPEIREVAGKVDWKAVVAAVRAGLREPGSAPGATSTGVEIDGVRCGQPDPLAPPSPEQPEAFPAPH